MADQDVHEIQLSGKQLFFLFMCAVVVAGVIFIFGVSVGRGVRNASGQEPRADVATDTAVPAGTPLAPPANPNDLSYSKTLEGRGPDPGKVAPPTPPSEEPATTGAASGPPPPAAPVRGTAAPVPAAPAAGGFLVQVEAFGSRDIAAREVAKLQRQGHPAFVFTAPDGTPGPRYKVQVGPFQTRAEADKTIKALRTEGYKPLIKR